MVKVRVVNTRYSRPYPVVIGEDILGDDSTWRMLFWLASLEPFNCLVVYQEPVARYADVVADSMTRLCGRVYKYRLPDGENAKSLEEVLKLISFMHEKGFSRRDLVAVVGGGAASDSAGFASAIYKRGLRYINVPTTLLSMIDAALGGKTAVNYKGVKNVVGAFHQPAGVLEDISILSSLPSTEFMSGLGELVKYAYTLSERLHEILQRGEVRQKLADIVYLGVDAKARIVELDEREELGMREILNFGHTFGHALESLTGVKHGIAVAWGCVVEAWAGVRLGFTPERVAEELQELVLRLGFPKPPLPSWEQLERLMRHDKKVHGERIRGVFTLGPGRGAVVEVMLHDYLSAVRWGAEKVWEQARV